MPGKTIGSVTFVVGMDGRALPAEARASGELAGLAAGEGFEEAFDKQFSGIGAEMAKNMKANGTLSGHSFTDSLRDVINSEKVGLANDLADIFGNSEGLDNYFAKVEDAAPAVEELRNKIGRLADAQGLSNEEFNRVNGELDRYVPKVYATAQANRDAAVDVQRHRSALADLKIGLADHAANLDRVTSAYKRFEGDSDKADTAVNKLGKSLKKVGNDRSFSNGMSTDAKQILAIVIALVAAAPQIGALGSLIGSGLVIAGGALAILVGGVAAAISSFTQLNDLTGKLPAGVKESQTAFKGLTDTFAELRKQMTLGFFSDLAGPLNALKDQAKALTPAFHEFGVQAGGAFAIIANAIASPAFANGISSILGAAGPILQQLVTAAVSLGGAIGNIFVAALPFIQQFATGLAGLMKQFLDWTNSVVGQASIDLFFVHATQLVGPLIDLVGSLAKTLSNLVTPQAVGQTANFLTQLAGFLPVVGQLLNVIGQLDLFGTAATLLNEFGQAIQPSIPLLSQLAGLIGGALLQVIQALVPALGTIVNAIVPFALALAQALIPAILALTPLFAPLAQMFADLLPILLPVATAILDMATQIITALVPAITPLIAQLPTLIPPFADLAMLLIQQLVPILDPLIQLIVGLLGAIVPLLPSLVPLIELGLKPTSEALELLGPIVAGVAQYLNDTLVPAVQLVTDVLKAIIDFITNAFAGKWDAAWKGIGGSFKKIWDDIVAVARGNMNGLIDLLNGITTGINNVTKVAGVAPIPKIPHVQFAAGGIVSRSTFAEIGEAGAEAVVPLNRPLSQVNPAVRELSAIAQGKAPLGANGRTVHNWEPGSVIVQVPTDDPEQVAHSVVDNIIAGL